MVLGTTLALPAQAHHGVAGLGVAGLRGPGAPIESTTSLTLPAGTTLTYLKLDRAEYEQFSSDPADPESDYADFWIAGVGRGFKPWLSAYLFLPYNKKVDEPRGFNTSGAADALLFAQLGFKYDEQFLLTPETESLDDLEDWHFTAYAGVTLPTGDPNLRDTGGNIDPGKSTGFGEPTHTLGATATKMLTQRLTFNQEISHLRFREHRYDDGNRTRFGDETRINSAISYRMLTDLERGFRMDVTFEAQYLRLERDRLNGFGQPATGGEMLYVLPGLRFYWEKMSVGVGVKLPARTDLNEEDAQQGGEGTEDYRFLFSFSAVF